MSKNIKCTIEFFDEWFLHEKKAIDSALSNECKDLNIEEFAVKAKRRIGEFLKYDTRTPIERVNSRDEFGRTLLELMREVKDLFRICYVLNNKFCLNMEPQQLVDIARTRFTDEYHLYLKRLYLTLFHAELAMVLVQNYNKNISEQFLIFMSGNKNICVELGIEVKDFEFSINLVTEKVPYTAISKANDILAERVKNARN